MTSDLTSPRQEVTAEPLPVPAQRPAPGAGAEPWPASSQSFWTFAVGVPAIISVMRLVVEAGGELQTTLLLIAHVNPVNLVGAFVTTSSRMVAALLILLFALSAVLAVSVDPVRRESGRDRRPLVVRWKRAAPLWFVIVVIVVAVATWQILYLPLLFLAVVAMFQLSPAQLHPHRVARLIFAVGVLAAYAWFLFPTVRSAARQGEYLVIVLLLAPAVLALVITGPIHPVTVRPLATFGPLIMLVAMCWTAYSVVTTPVLPTTVTTVEAAQSALPDEEIRGHVVDVNDVHAVILQENGGVRYVPVDDVESQVLCPNEEELPRFRLWVHGFHVEDSVLEALGRRERPMVTIDAACRAPH